MSARAATVNWGNPPDWLYEAEAQGITPRCRGVSLDLFFPEAGEGHPTARNVNRAKAICESGCPLYDPCREWALDQPAMQLYGVWGGTSRGDRLHGQLGNRAPQPEQFRKANEQRTKKENAA